MSKELRIREDSLEELIQHIGSSLVGKLMKRMELFDDLSVIKKESKELVYEQLRQLKDLLIAHSAGLDMVKIDFVRGPNSKEKKS